MQRSLLTLCRRCCAEWRRASVAFGCYQAPLAFSFQAFSTTSLLFSPSNGFVSTKESTGQQGTNNPTQKPVSILDASGASVSVKPLESFSELKGAAEWLVSGLQQLRYPSTTDIQKYTIPLLEEGHDLIGLAPTGSGKTVAFAVPALKRMQRNPDGSPSVLVLAPTRELVQQTTKVFEQLSNGTVRICEAYGGAPREIQARRLHNGCDVLVACPGRLKDFLDGGDVSIRNLSFMVFDEADRLLDMGFQIQLDAILSYVDKSSRPQAVMWSATWPRSVQDLARNYLAENRLIIRAGTAGTGLQVNERITQKIIFSQQFSDRINALVKLIESGEINDNTDKLIIFVERQSDTEDAANSLSQRLGIDSRYVGVLHGGLSQRSRDRVMDSFKNNYVRLLVATDVASRGLDIPDVTCVVNFQAPKNIDSYCHRIGRTGRAGRSGTAYTFIGKGDGGLAADLVEYLKKSKMDVPPELLEIKEEFQRRNGSRSRGYGRDNRGSYRRNSRPQNNFGSERRGSNFSLSTGDGGNRSGGEFGW